MIKKILIVLLFTSAIVNAQNTAIIKTTFNNQNIDHFDALAIENGVQQGKDVFVRAYFKADSVGKVFGVEMAEKWKFFEPALTSIIKNMPQLDPKEYLKKGKEMKYGVMLSFKLSKAKAFERRIKKGEKAKLILKRFFIKEYFPVKWIALDAKDEPNKNDMDKVEQIPIPENCKDFIVELEIRKCVQNTIRRHVGMKFDLGLVPELGMAPGKLKITTKFVISKEGEIVNIISDATNARLHEESVRVVNLIPKFYKPGAIDGKPVNVNYTLPITLMVE